MNKFMLAKWECVTSAIFTLHDIGNFDELFQLLLGLNLEHLEAQYFPIMSELATFATKYIHRVKYDWDRVTV